MAILQIPNLIDLIYLKVIHYYGSVVTPRISNKLRGSLGETYYKEYCDQKGWAYTSLENIHSSMNDDWVFVFKKGFHRIKVQIPKDIRDEIKWLVRPTNNSESSPSFVFDFLACKVGQKKEYTGVQKSDSFAWVENKTGVGIFSSSQANAMSRIKLPLAIFHINDVLAEPKNIVMGSDIKSGKEWLRELEPIDNEIYEFNGNAKLAKSS